MFSHGDIWVAIDRLANSAGYSTSGLARKAGLDATAFNKSKRMSPEGKPRWPSTESLSKILAVTNITMSEFMTLIEIETIPCPQSPAMRMSKTIPVIGYAQAGAAGYFDDAGYPQGQGWDTVELPALAPVDESTYALEVSGDSMQPLYRDGDILVVSPHSDIRRGDRVVIRTTDGQVMAKELARQTANRIDLISLNADHDPLSFAPQDLQWIARILWVSQ